MTEPQMEMSRQVRRKLERQGSIRTVSQVAERDKILCSFERPKYLYPVGWPNDDWTQVELFRLSHDRLPNEPGDNITQETLDEFCLRYDAGKISSRTTDLDALRAAIATGRVTITNHS
jgi:hypothetical protein